MTTFIYALCEPGTRTVRYVGKANDPKRRFRAHMLRSVKADNHLGAWLRHLQVLGKKPALIILREIPECQWQLAEERYIRLARGCQMNLVNSTDGGDGMHNPSTETRAKIASQQKDRMASPEAREKLAAANRGKTPSSETRAKISNANRGKIRSVAARKNYSKSKQGSKNPNFGGVPAATLAAATLVNTGSKRSATARVNISNALKASWRVRKEKMSFNPTI